MLQLRLNLKKAKLKREFGHHFDKMDVFVVIRCDHLEWHSSVKLNAGKKSKWGGEFMEINQDLWGRNVQIEVRD